MADTRPEKTGRKPRDGAAHKAAPEPNRAERLLTPNDAADFLRLSSSWLAKARMRGDGPAFVKIGRSVRYAEGSLREYLEGQTRHSTSEQ
jgi:predicted DNA-binding transcriptional regulator AlpA